MPAEQGVYWPQSDVCLLLLQLMTMMTKKKKKGMISNRNERASDKRKPKSARREKIFRFDVYLTLPKRTPPLQAYNRIESNRIEPNQTKTKTKTNRVQRKGGRFTKG